MLQQFILSILILTSITQAANASDTLTLSQVIDVALENNFAVQIASTQKDIAANNNTAGNAGMLPIVELYGSNTSNVQNSFFESFTAAPRSANNAHSNVVNANAMADWTIFDGMKMFATKSGLELMEKMGEYEYRSMIETTIIDLVNAYNILVLRQHYYENLYEAYQISNERNILNSKKISIGTGSTVMLMQSIIDMNADSVNMIMQHKLIEQGKADLNFLMGRDPATPIEVTSSALLNELNSYESLMDKIYGQNNELLNARLNVELAHQNLLVVRSERLPKLNIFGGYSYMKGTYDIGNAKSIQNYGPTYGAIVTMRVFNGFNTNLKMQNAHFNQDIAANQYNQKELEIKSQLSKMYSEYKYSKQIYDIEKQNIEIAQQNLTLAFERYKLGVLNDIDFRNIQFKVVNAQYSFYVAEFNVRSAEVELLKVAGELIKVYQK